MSQPRKHITALTFCIETLLLSLASLSLLITLTGGFTVSCGPFRVSIHQLSTILLAIGVLLACRRRLTGKFGGRWLWTGWITPNSNRIALPAERLVISLLVLLLLSGGLQLVNPLQRGLSGWYYENPNWMLPQFYETIDTTLTLAKIQRRFPSLQYNYSIKWRGTIHIPISGAYEFTLISKDGSELSIAGQEVIAHHGEHDFTEKSGQIMLAKGFYPIRILYQFLDGPGGAGFKLSWKMPGHKRKTVSSHYLFLKPPSRQTLVIGYGIEMLLAICTIGGLLWCGSLGLVIWQNFRHAPQWGQQAVTIAALFGFVFLTHFFGSDNTTSFDSMWALPTAISLEREGNLDLDEYRNAARQVNYYGITMLDGHLYNYYPIGTPVLITPLVSMLDQFLERAALMDLHQFFQNNHQARLRLEIGYASVIVAVTTIIIYLMAQMLGQSRRYAVFLALIFAFGTSAWSTASRALWQHGPIMLLLAGMVALSLYADRRPQSARWCMRIMGVLAAFSFLVRPTNIVSILAFSLLIVLRYRRHFIAYCLWALLVMIPFVFSNIAMYHSMLPPYYTSSHQLRLTWQMLIGLIGMLVSPSRGLFVFSPVLLFAGYGLWLKIRARQMHELDILIGTAIIGHWMLSALHPNWWGGHSYGPRYLTDILPYLLYFLAPLPAYIMHKTGQRKYLLVIVFGMTLAVSVFIHWRGATAWDVFGWNAGIDREPWRVWDVTDVQFLHGYGP